MERTVIGDDLAGEEGQADDDEKEGVQPGAGDEQARPENIEVIDTRGSITDFDQSI